MEIFKEYLVKIGYDVDNVSQQKIQNALRQVELTLTSLGKSPAFKILASTATMYASVLTTVITATAGMMKKTADADMEYQKMAMRMHMTTQMAKEMTVALETLGASVEEVMWNPELRKQYHELRSLVGAASAPKDAQEQWRMIRSVGFEFTKLMTLLKMGAEQVSYYLAKIFGKDIQQLRKWLQDINKWILENLPKWSEKIAQFLARFVRIGKVTWDILKGIYEVLKGFIGAMPKVVVGLGAMYAAFTMLGRHPVLAALRPILLGLIGLFLLLDDYATFKKAKREGTTSITTFGSVWRVLDEQIPKLKKSAGELVNSLSKLLSPKNVDKGFWDWFAAVIDRLAKGFAIISFGVLSLAAFLGHLINPEAAKQREEVQGKYGPLIQEQQDILEGVYSKHRHHTAEEKKQARAKLKALKQQRDTELAEIQSKSRWDAINEVNEALKDLRSYFPTKEGQEIIRKTQEDYKKQMEFQNRGAPGPTSWVPSNMPAGQEMYSIHIGELNLPGVTSPKEFLDQIAFVARQQRVIS